jgi:collagenase-like PrtC family protease
MDNFIIDGSREQKIDFLLAAGVDASVENDFGMTALMYAAYYPKISIIRKLIASCNNMYYVNEFGESFHSILLQNHFCNFDDIVEICQEYNLQY